MQIVWQEKTYDFEPSRDMTLSRLRLVKSWFPAIGSYLKFINAYGEGDPDALACVMWVIRTKSGESSPEPTNMDNFAAGEFWAAIGTAVMSEFNRLKAEAEAAVAVDPTDGPHEAHSSLEIPEPETLTPTPTSSETDTSDSSPTSAI